MATADATSPTQRVVAPGGTGRTGYAVCAAATRLCDRVFSINRSPLLVFLFDMFDVLLSLFRYPFVLCQYANVYVVKNVRM